MRANQAERTDTGIVHEERTGRQKTATLLQQPAKSEHSGFAELGTPGWAKADRTSLRYRGTSFDKTER